MSRDYFLVNDERRVKLEVFGGSRNLYNPDELIAFLLSYESEKVRLIELDELGLLEEEFGCYWKF